MLLSDDHPRRRLRQAESRRDVQAPIEYCLAAWRCHQHRRNADQKAWDIEASSRRRKQTRREEREVGGRVVERAEKAKLEEGKRKRRRRTEGVREE